MKSKPKTTYQSANSELLSHERIDRLARLSSWIEELAAREHEQPLKTIQW